MNCNVTCDNCGLLISEIRYKCQQCANFDLCASCYEEHKGHAATHKHSQHLTEQQNGVKHLFLRINDDNSDKSVARITIGSSRADMANLSAFVHSDMACVGCNMSPIVGFRFSCIECAGIHLCDGCERTGLFHDPFHPRVKVLGRYGAEKTSGGGQSTSEKSSGGGSKIHDTGNCATKVGNAVGDEGNISSNESASCTGLAVTPVTTMTKQDPALSVLPTSMEPQAEMTPKVGLFSGSGRSHVLGAGASFVPTLNPLKQEETLSSTTKNGSSSACKGFSFFPATESSVLGPEPLPAHKVGHPFNGNSGGFAHASADKDGVVPPLSSAHRIATNPPLAATASAGHHRPPNKTPFSFGSQPSKENVGFGFSFGITGGKAKGSAGSSSGVTPFASQSPFGMGWNAGGSNGGGFSAPFSAGKPAEGSSFGAFGGGSKPGLGIFEPAKGNATFGSSVGFGTAGGSGALSFGRSDGLLSPVAPFGLPRT